MRGALSLLMPIALTLGACAGVLGLNRASSGRPFEHRAHAEHGVNCVACHKGVATAGDDGPLHLPSANDCRACHAKPHDDRECSDCHGESHVRGGAELAKQHLRFAHGAHMAEVHGDCVRCHVGAGDARPVTLRPTMATCFGCHAHEDAWHARDCDSCHVDLHEERTLPASHVVHDGDWLREHGVRAAAARDLCATCHTERSWRTLS